MENGEMQSLANQDELGRDAGVVDVCPVVNVEDDASSDREALQQEVKSLKEQLKLLTDRVTKLESASEASRNRLKSAPSAASNSRRRTLDPVKMRAATTRSTEDLADGPASSRSRRSYTPNFSRPKTGARDKLPTIKDKEEPGTYRMYLQGRPILFRLPEGYEQPSNPEPAEASAQQLKLDWVHGYRGKDCRCNVWLLDSGEIVYFTAAVCVIQHLDQSSQRHYTEHTDDIKCLSLHPNRVIVATGQVAGHEKPAKGKGANKAAAANPHYQPHVRIWSSATLETLKVIGYGAFDRAVACLSFSVTDGGQLLCAVDEHNDHRLSVWDWNKTNRGSKLAEIKASQDAVYQAEFHPQEANQIVCCGKNQLSFWSLLDGKNLVKKMGLFERHDKPKFVTCLAFSPEGHVYTGDSNGSIFVWPRGSNKIGSVLSLAAHEGVVLCLSFLSDGTLISGGGKDGLIKSWDIQTKAGQTITELPEEYGCPRVLLKTEELFIIGTNKNVILSGKNLSEPSIVTQGHYGELWGLVECRTEDRFVTCAYDNSVRMWDVTGRRLLWTVYLPESLHCVALDVTGSRLAVGSRTANWYVYNTESQQLVNSGACGSEQLECVEFSPDGTYVAFGSRDNHIYLYKIADSELHLIGKCQGHSSFITHIDWSTDNGYLRSNSGDYELLYWEVPACKQYTEGDQIRAMEFATQNCVLSLNTVGMWQKGADGTDINGCCVNHSGNLLASADDFGKVNLYSYPSRTPEAKAHSYSGHSSHVTSVRFTQADNYLLSTGGKDSTIIQWALC